MRETGEYPKMMQSSKETNLSMNFIILSSLFKNQTDRNLVGDKAFDRNLIGSVIETLSA